MRWSASGILEVSPALAALWSRWADGWSPRWRSWTNSSPLDQFFAAQPDILLDAPSEEARIDPDNVEILIQHLKCAAFELPFEHGERFGTLEPDAVGEGLISCPASGGS